MASDLTKCIKCGADKVNAEECPSCGVIYAKAEKVFYEKIKEEIRQEEIEPSDTSEEVEANKSADDGEKENDNLQETYDELKAEKSKHHWVAIVIVLAAIVVTLGGFILDDSDDSSNLSISRNTPAVSPLSKISNSQRPSNTVMADKKSDFFNELSRLTGMGEAVQIKLNRCDVNLQFHQNKDGCGEFIRAMEDFVSEWEAVIEEYGEFIVDDLNVTTDQYMVYTLFMAHKDHLLSETHRLTGLLQGIDR